MFKSITIYLSIFFISLPSAFAEEIHGAGATFPAPVYLKWAESYSQRKGIKIDYLGVGSGEGIKRIDAKNVDFGASDMPLHVDELTQKSLLQFPMLLGAITPVVNLPGVLIAQLRLDGPTLAAIYLGKISQWNDPQLGVLNPGLKLPDIPIIVVHREEKSGTTFNFTNYLSKVSSDWRNSTGEGLTVKWAVGLAEKGNAGVADKVKLTPGAIGYVEYAFAMEHGLDYVQLKNSAGNFVKPNSASTEAAAQGAAWDASKGFYQILTDAPGAGSWPIVATTFILVQRNTNDSTHSKEVLKFFDSAYRTGELVAVNQDYVMIPKSVTSQIRTSWSELKSSDGKTVW